MYIQLFHLHGLTRSQNPELGRDADTGGQTKYVLELARALGKRRDVTRVDVLTRRVEDPRVDPEYARPIEHISRKARIVRIRCGGRRYRRKESLWPHLDEFVDNCIRYIRSQRRLPHALHAHYADAGYVATQLARFFGIPLVFTGHSMGHEKRRRLIDGGMTAAEAEKRYMLAQRIGAEEYTLRYANLIVTSTRQERDKQYAPYPETAAPFVVIPPGIDLRTFRPYTRAPRDAESRRIRAALHAELDRFHMVRSKPMVLTLSRPDRRKNIPALVRAYGSDPELKKVANLAIFAGIRRDLRMMPDNERSVLTNMLLLMDIYDLYGRMAIPKRHDFETEVPELYRIAARTNGVFVNPALTEPFGITLIEAAASGLPVVAPDDGGPREIIENCNHGVLVDTTDDRAIAEAVHEVIGDKQRWHQLSRSGIEGVQRHYTWEAHVERYTQALRELQDVPSTFPRAATGVEPIGRRLHRVGRLLVTDIDDTLIGDPEALALLIELLKSKHAKLGFGVATGRTYASACAVLEEYGVPRPDIMITSVGAEIYLGNHTEPDKGWSSHIQHRWNRAELAATLESMPGLELQEDEVQNAFKLSYYTDEDFDIDAVREALSKLRSRCTMIHSHDSYLDLLPHRASKGRAVRYLAYRWDIPHQSIVVAGDSGNDREMLLGRLRGVVVSNHKPELDDLKMRRRADIYFSPEPHAAGIIDGLRHYGFVTQPRRDGKRDAQRSVPATETTETHPT